MKTIQYLAPKMESLLHSTNNDGWTTIHWAAQSDHESVEVQIGLAYLANDSHAAGNCIIAHLCTQAATDEVQQYCQILFNCSCNDCLRDGSCWRSRPCRMSEAKPNARMIVRYFQPTYLHQCFAGTMGCSLQAPHCGSFGSDQQHT